MPRNYNYTTITKFGDNEPNPVDDPLSYCMPTVDNYFIHGPQSWKIMTNSKPCQAYLSEYCAQGWDGFCEASSRNTEDNVVNQIDISKNVNDNLTTAGEILIRNTAAKKYLVSMDMCKKKVFQFDPLVSNSPNIYYWENSYDNSFKNENNCTPKYAVDPKTIEDDEVMKKILAKPSIADDILRNIYKTMKSDGTLLELKDTKLGYYFSTTYGETFQV